MDASADGLERAVRKAVTEALRELGVPADGWPTTEQAADHLGTTPDTLKCWRSRGTGPPFHRANGRLVRYQHRELDAWVRGEG
jgi:hypothetical protein